ncbi:MAG: hypothetical protein COV74_05990 [Candidatus Omnitrophica bacterium CG11_big_fil_rev_8_21_14_0_20_45_26]|uniref:TonB-dependent receptor-like beta-barrel domain-containing protein n=1 Tax=Candidatus Abzuiibacterium crystallinum TaxID=1974748 RepID=A0A2H0LP10_9BACT|nr:MAG: hypothetical protein COV74_05990 [Candidatus Omnitrophica bacterium CG11_big_fil_rev_8_21_14_0_20_45_26]
MTTALALGLSSVSFAQEGENESMWWNWFRTAFENVGGDFDHLWFEPSISNYFVYGDQGRFRQDFMVSDATTGGVKDFGWTKKKDGIQYEFDLRALVNYDYLSHLRISKENEYYADARWKKFRKYWDGGASEPWDPEQYRLPGEFADWDDGSLYTERSNVDIELGRSLGDNADLIFEYHLWKREGRETLLRGERARATGLPDLRTIPARARVEGVSNTFVLRVPFTVGDKHHIEPSLSYEAYRDDQLINFPRYVNGAIDQDRTFIDVPEFDDLKFKITYESFLSDETYVHGGYYFDFLRNDTARSSVRPSEAESRNYVNGDVDNWRVSNVVAAGAALLNFLNKQGLDLRAGIRGEHSLTDTHSTGQVYTVAAQKSMPDVFAGSSMREGRFGESLSLTYRGLPRTTLYAGLEMEQRALNWVENFDARMHELVTDFGSTELFPHYETDIVFVDFMPTFKMSHRLNSRIKFNTQYRWKAKERQYDTKDDSLPTFYPGILGDQEQSVHEITAKTDIHLGKGWFNTFKYQFVSDDISFEKRGKNQQDLDRHRFSTTFSGPIGQKLMLFTSGMYEVYRINTPTYKDASGRWSTGTGAFDYNGDVFLISVNGHYRFTGQISLYANYQLTASLGDNANNLNEIAAGIQYDINSNTSLEAGYQLFNFRDDRDGFGGGKFDDDYHGHGFSIGFKTAFA